MTPHPRDNAFATASGDIVDYVQGAPVGLHITGPDGTIQWANLAELHLLGGRDSNECIGRHMTAFYTETELVNRLLDALASGDSVAGCVTTVSSSTAGQRLVVLYANARMENRRFQSARFVTMPHPDDLFPEISALGALRDFAELPASGDEPNGCFRNLGNDLEDFFENAPVGCHIVGGDGLIRRANRTELTAMDCEIGSYVGAHIARFHADGRVIDGMLNDLVTGKPLVNFHATLNRNDGMIRPVTIYSNSRMRDGRFINTRCFTVDDLKGAAKPSPPAKAFAWPRNQDPGFSAPAGNSTKPCDDPMTIALRYVGTRKGPEESLGFLASVSQVLGARRPFAELLQETVQLTVPFLADFCSIDGIVTHLAHTTNLSLNCSAAALAQWALNRAARVREKSTNPPGSAEKPSECHTAVSHGACDAEGLQLYSIQSTVTVPIVIRGDYFGTVTLMRKHGRMDFGAADVALAEEFSRRIGFSIEIGRSAAGEILSRADV